MDEQTHDADRGFLAAPLTDQVLDASGRVVHDGTAYAFLDAEAPGTVHPGLWEHSRRSARAGLYEVCEGLYQVRGTDLANLTVVEGDTGVVVIDTLTSAETAAAALALYRSVRGERPVRGVVITHPHADHFGGIDGVLEGAGDVPVVVPEGFAEHAVSENLLAGPAMSRRSAYMYGTALEPSPTGHVGCGLGPRLARGRTGLPRPTREVRRTGEVVEIDGVVMEMQLTPGTEAPAEMNVLLPGLRALCVAENAVHSMHNIITLRGAQVRDARAWARYLDKTIELYADRADVVLATHHWPTWGTDRARHFLEDQRDVYAYLHDQTVRLMNRGLTPREIAEQLELPPALAESPAGHGYYGSLSHNVKGIYQRYLGWYDANPARLWPLPPEQEARQWMRVVGGTGRALAAARELVLEGELRFAATLLDHVVFADPQEREARELLAEVYRRLAAQTENATWRNCFLTGALELVEGTPPAAGPGGGLLGGVGVEELLDVLAVRVDGPRAWDADASFDWEVPGEGTWRLWLRRGVLRHRRLVEGAEPGAAVVRADVRGLVGLLRGDAAGAQVSGDGTRVGAVLGALEPASAPFAIVEP
ncbi:alkyl/aryl-sulfatase [Aeromicrobium massiliense]|uniref:alkyl/aryl-sulfatase n=1 Tax=Aeromicrobium massiliense TaxID=1464554 RepID=UPI00067453EE|nr:alkyl sulfatase dimerization domain-containing protein [Aeromicrobium massiliense]